MKAQILTAAVVVSALLAGCGATSSLQDKSKDLTRTKGSDTALLDGSNEDVDFEKLRGPQGGQEAVRLVATTKFSVLVEKMKELPNPEPRLRAQLIRARSSTDIWKTPGRTGHRVDFQNLLSNADVPNLLFAHVSDAGRLYRARENDYRTNQGSPGFLGGWNQTSFLQGAKFEEGDWQILYLAYQFSRANEKGYPDHLGYKWGPAIGSPDLNELSFFFSEQCEFWYRMSKAQAQRKAGVDERDIVPTYRVGSPFAMNAWPEQKCGALLQIWPAYRSAIKSRDWNRMF